jgi:hypothetical protein
MELSDSWFDAATFCKVVSWAENICQSAIDRPKGLTLAFTNLNGALNLYITMRNLRMSGWQKMEPILAQYTSEYNLAGDDLHTLVDNIPYKHPLVQVALENVVRMRQKSKAPTSEGGKCSQLLRSDHNAYFGRIMKMEREAKQSSQLPAAKHAPKKVNPKAVFHHLPQPRVVVPNIPPTVGPTTPSYAQITGTEA